MIIDVGQLGFTIKMTVAYSNAVIAAFLPQASDFANKLDVPIPQPIAITNIVRSGIVPLREGDGPVGIVMIKGDQGKWSFSFMNGYVNTFADENSYEGSFDVNKFDKKWLGTVNMTKAEAVAMARKTILKL